MEQRALLASALVLGCVTAAGAGGYLAVRQMAAPDAPRTTEASGPATPSSAPVDPLEGTVAEIDAPATPSVAPAPAPAPAARARESATHPGPAPATRPTPRPAPPVQATTARREPIPAPVARDTSSAPVRPAAEPSVSAPVTPRADETPRDTWPTRDADTASRNDRWPSRDASVGSTGDTSFPRTSNDGAADTQASTRRYESVTIPADAVVGVQIETGASTATARVEDPIRARVTRDVLAGGSVVIPAGSKLMGSVTLVEEGGKIRERARLGVRFHTLVLSDGTEVRLQTAPIYREGESPAGRSTAKIGGAAIGGAILGAIMGGGKGAVIGAATGAGSGTGWAMADERKPAELRAGQSVTVRVSNSVTTEIVR